MLPGLAQFMFFWTLPAILIETWLLSRWLSWSPTRALRKVLLVHLAALYVNFWLYSKQIFYGMGSGLIHTMGLEGDSSSIPALRLFWRDVVLVLAMVFISTLVESLLLPLLAPQETSKSRVLAFTVIVNIISYTLMLVLLFCWVLVSAIF